ncbi:MAG: hypothetical protein OCD00_08215 [Colwellia sp.]
MVRNLKIGCYSKRFSCEWEAAELRDNAIAKHFFCEDDNGEWPTMNFILWNTDTRDNELIVHDSKLYNEYMERNREDTLELGVE